MTQTIYSLLKISSVPYCTYENELNAKIKVCNAHDWSPCLQHFSRIGDFLLLTEYRSLEYLESLDMTCTEKLLCYLFTPKKEVYCNPCEKLSNDIAKLEACFDERLCKFIERSDSTVKQVECNGPCNYFSHQESCFPAADNSTKADCSAILEMKECGVYDDTTELSGDIEF